MSEKHVIYEISQKMSDTSVIQNDMNEATELVMQMFRDKYFSRLNTAISEHNAQCQKNPSKEVRLLHALKPFFPEDQGEKIEQFIQVMLFRDTAESVKKELKINAPAKPVATAEIPASKVETAQVESIHEDGIYDVDRSCMVRKHQASADFSGALLMMAMLYSGFRG